MKSIAASMACGCANITMIYALPVLFAVHVAALGFALEGLVRGKKAAGKRWERLVRR